jgi:hypothetical protein
MTFWLGLGGFLPIDKTFEQVGLELDCIGPGPATFEGWYYTNNDQNRERTLALTSDFADPGSHLWAQISDVRGRFTMTLANLDPGRG